MEKFQLNASLREARGRREAKRMRRGGSVPAVIYGNGDNMSVTLQEADLPKLLVTPNVYLIELSVDGKVEPVLLKEVQYHPVSDRPIHIDFYRYNPSKPIEVAIPVQLEGHAKGVKAGGKLVSGVRRVRVTGLAENLPDRLVVDISNLKVGDTLMVENLSFENLTVSDHKNLIVASVKSQRGVTASSDEEHEEEA